MEQNLLLDSLMVFQIVNKWRPKIFHRVCSSCCWTLSWAICIQSTPSHFHSKIQFIINHLLTPTGSILSLWRRTFCQNFVCVYYFVHVIGQCASIFFWYYHPDHTCWWVWFMKLIITYFSLSLFYVCAFFPDILLRTLFFHIVPVFFSLVRETSVYCHKQSNRQRYSFLYFVARMFRFSEAGG